MNNYSFLSNKAINFHLFMQTLINWFLFMNKKYIKIR